MGQKTVERKGYLFSAGTGIILILLMLCVIGLLCYGMAGAGGAYSVTVLGNTGYFMDSSHMGAVYIGFAYAFFLVICILIWIVYVTLGSAGQRTTGIPTSEVGFSNDAHKFIVVYDMEQCPSCRSSIPAGHVYCCECGARLINTGFNRNAARCKRCGAVLENDASFCVHCGEKRE